MTNSHNRPQSGARNAERYYTNASPQQGSYCSSNKRRGQKSPNTTYFNSIASTTAPLPITPPKSNNGYGNNRHQNNYRSSPGGFSYSSSPSNSSYGGAGGLTVSSSPPNFSYYAGSKCYDAPAPTALPRPPTHWTLSCAQVAAQFNKPDDYSQNLKMMLNVKA
jgi:hypothetical protein